jgi:hypothetical protein
METNVAISLESSPENFYTLNQSQPVYNQYNPKLVSKGFESYSSAEEEHLEIETARRWTQQQTNDSF